MVFSRRVHHYKWTMNKKPLEQMSVFKYLGVVFHQSGSWTAHIDCAQYNLERAVLGILRCYRKREGCQF